MTNDGGLIEQNLFELEVEALPLSVPTVIEADVTIMSLDRSLSVADLDLAEGVKAMIPDEISVASPYIPRIVEEVVPEVELDEDGEPIVPAEGEEGAEGSDAEGESSGDSDGDGEGKGDGKGSSE